MFVRRKRSILNRKYKSESSNVAFICRRKFSGFTKGKLYKPFAYSFNAEYYKNFCVLDNNGYAMFMESNLIEKGFFEVTYTNCHSLEQRIKDIMDDVDRENEKYKKMLAEWVDNSQKQERGMK
ncbi:MAG: hypothetical protein Q4A15_10530 [Prevotellaceae bacterium]|nr:hypothetical protein [Prevotellaceae bacterium]